MKNFFFCCICSIFTIFASSQSLIVYPYTADANASGYANQYTQQIILEQQNQSAKSRSIYDSSFNLLRSYQMNEDSFSIVQYFERPYLVNHCITKDGIFDVYYKSGEVFLRKVDMEKEKDITVVKLIFKPAYNGEKLLAIVPGKKSISFLSIIKNQQKLKYQEISTENYSILTLEYNLPKRTLSAQEEKIYSAALSLRYNNVLKNFSVFELYNPSRFDVTMNNKLYYTDTTLHLFIPLRYGTGYHLLTLNRTNSNISTANFVVNKINPDTRNTSSEDIVSMAACDSILVIRSFNLKKFEYRFFNLFSSHLLQHYAVPVEDSITALVNSPFIQLGTRFSKDQEKDFDNPKAFIRRLGNCSNFTNVYRSEGDSLVVSFGGFQYIESIRGILTNTVMSAVIGSLVPSDIVFAAVPMPYIMDGRWKFLMAHSLFNGSTLKPSRSTSFKTVLNKIVDDKNVDDLGAISSFVIELSKQLYIGIFNKQKNTYKVYRY